MPFGQICGIQSCRICLKRCFSWNVTLDSQDSPNYSKTWGHQQLQSCAEKIWKIPNHKRDTAKRAYFRKFPAETCPSGTRSFEEKETGVWRKSKCGFLCMCTLVSMQAPTSVFGSALDPHLRKQMIHRFGVVTGILHAHSQVPREYQSLASLRAKLPFQSALKHWENRPDKT